MHNEPQKSSGSKQANIWPPAPVRPPQTVLVQSKEMLGLLTNYFLLDFFLGLMLGPVACFVLFFLFGVVLEWIVPTLPIPKYMQWWSWGLPTLGAVAIFVFFIRRYTYLMVGYATTTLVLVAIGLLLLLSV